MIQIYKYSQSNPVHTCQHISRTWTRIWSVICDGTSTKQNCQLILNIQYLYPYNMLKLAQNRFGDLKNILSHKRKHYQGTILHISTHCSIKRAQV